MIANLITTIIILATIIAASIYIYRSKKKGQACIGCPYSGQCNKKCSHK